MIGPPPQYNIRDHNNPAPRLNLMIGGPRNGHVTDWTLPELETAEFAGHPGVEYAAPKIVTHRYRRQSFACDGHIWFLYIHSSLTTSEAFATLAGSYPVACGHPPFRAMPIAGKEGA